MTPEDSFVYSPPRLVVRGLVRGGGLAIVDGEEGDMARVSIFPAGTTVDGDVLCDEDVIVEGCINGTVAVEGVLLVEDTGVVRGDVRGGRVVVRGVVVGAVTADDAVLVEEGARVVGDIFSPRVHIEEGALFRGRVEIEGEGAWDVDEQGVIEASPPVRVPEEPAVETPRPRRTRRNKPEEAGRADESAVLGQPSRRRSNGGGAPSPRMPVVGRAKAHRRAYP